MIHLYGNVYLTADSLQFITYEKKIIEKGKHEGEESLTNYKYFPSLAFVFREVFNTMLMNELSDEDEETIEELKEKYNDLLEHLIEISTNIGSVKQLKSLVEQDKTLI